MIILAATLAAFGITDLCRGDARPRSMRTGATVLGAVLTAGGLARLAGMDCRTVAIIAGAEALALAGWVILDARAKGPGAAVVALVWIVAAPVAAIAASGAVPAVSGSLARPEGVAFTATSKTAP